MKKRKVTTTITIFLLAMGLIALFFSTMTVGFAASDAVEYGDLVNVQYWLYLNPDYSGDAYDSGIINYVYVSQGTTVPNDILQQYPDAAATYLEDFKTNLVGMKEGETKRFVIPAERGYNDPRYGELYGKDLYFQVKLLKIVYKSAGGGGGSTSGTQGFLESNSTLILLGGALAAIVLGVAIYNYRAASQRKKYETKSSLEATTKVIHGSYDKRLHSLKELSSSLEQTRTTKKSAAQSTSKLKPRTKNLKPRKR